MKKEITIDDIKRRVYKNFGGIITVKTRKDAEMTDNLIRIGIREGARTERICRYQEELKVLEKHFKEIRKKRERIAGL